MNITVPAATQITGWHSILFILYTTARLHCICLCFTMLYFIAFSFVCCSLSVIFSLRATMLINLNLNLNEADFFDQNTVNNVLSECNVT